MSNEEKQVWLTDRWSEAMIPESAAARVLGQAVGVRHMREHAMVATDYAIKVVGLDSQWAMNRITEEREWQLKELIRYIK